MSQVDYAKNEFRRRIKRVLRKIGKEEMTDTVVQWYMKNKREMNLKEFNQLVNEWQSSK